MNPERSTTWLTPAAPEAALGLTGDFPEPILKLLENRGIADQKQLQEFLTPRLSSVKDPFLLPDMENAVERIWEAVCDGERITVFGDYDVDGMTSTALLTRVLRQAGATVSPFLPDRETEGYGFTVTALQRALGETRPNLIITVDCGTNSVEAVEVASRLGCDVIVTDHHAAEAPASPLALINPQLGDDEDMKRLAGVGVAFKLCHALIKSGRDLARDEIEGLDLRYFLDYVAIGTIADMVPLIGENRILATHGLTRLEQTQWVGLKALIALSGAVAPFNGSTVGFVLGPRLNAAGRVGAALMSLELLLTDDADEAARLASSLEQANKERRSIQKQMEDEAIAILDKTFDSEKDFGLVIAQAGWHMGVVGIVATRLMRRYHRPAVVVALEEDGSGRGSCRSVEGMNLVEALAECKDELTQYGGHAMAAGLSMAGDQVESFRAAFNEACRTRLGADNLSRQLRVDGWLEHGHIDQAFVDALERLKPFGKGHDEPVWGVRGVRLVSPARIVGEKHLKLRLGSGASEWDAIAFGMAEREIPDGEMDVAGHLQLNIWQGRVSVQMQVRDFRPTE